MSTCSRKQNKLQKTIKHKAPVNEEDLQENTVNICSFVWQLGSKN